MTLTKGTSLSEHNTNDRRQGLELCSSATGVKTTDLAIRLGLLDYWSLKVIARS